MKLTKWEKRRILSRLKGNHVVRVVAESESGIKAVRKPRKPRKKRKPRNRMSKGEFLQKCSNELNESLPASEKWFWFLYNQTGLRDSGDLANEPFLGKIPDILNKDLRYIIEVQDPTHNLPERVADDRRKHALWRARGYAVFIVWAWSDQSFEQFVSLMRDYRTRVCKK